MASGKFAFSKALRELRFHFCQTSSESNATRSFLLRAYPTMKKHNPYIPILIREAQQVGPKVWARYEFGKEKMIPLNGLSDKEIEDRVSTLVKESS